MRPNPTLPRPAIAAIAATAVLSILTPTASAQLQPGGYTTLTTEHADLAVLWTGTELELHIHDEDNDIEYATDEALLFVPDVTTAFGNGRITRPADAAWNFTGAAAGAPIWTLPSSQDPDLLYLGIANEDLAEFPALFATQTTFSLISVTGYNGAPAPGAFSLYRIAGVTPTAVMASSDGISAADSVVVGSAAGFGHSHFNYAFSSLGIYEVTLRATATLAAGGTVTDQRTFTFGVGTSSVPGTATVPEAGTLGLVLAAGTPLAGLALARRRRRARRA
jgi:surface-anchored protein